MCSLSVTLTSNSRYEQQKLIFQQHKRVQYRFNPLRLHIIIDMYMYLGSIPWQVGESNKVWEDLK